LNRASLLSFPINSTLVFSTDGSRKLNCSFPGSLRSRRQVLQLFVDHRVAADLARAIFAKRKGGPVRGCDGRVFNGGGLSYRVCSCASCQDSLFPFSQA
jgi:hypothetical protein